MLECHKTTEDEKRIICEWKYDGEYAIYNSIPYEKQVETQRGFANPKNNYYDVSYVCETSFQEKGLGRTRAQHVYEKLGFHRVRIHENSWKNQLGELQSSIDYELKPDDFIDFSK